MLEVLKNFLWSPVIVVNLACIGLIILFKTRFYTIVRLPIIFKESVFSVGKNPKAFGLMCTSLGGTIGVGNAVGVAGAILEGGAGAVFWMGIAGILGMAIKYTEVYFAKLYDKKGFGAISYIEYCSGTRFFSILYAFLTILVSFGMGNLSQTKTATTSLVGVLSLREEFIAISICVAFLFIAIGGIEKIRRFSEISVPVFAILYLSLLAIILFRQRDFLPSAIRCITTSSGVICGLKWSMIKLGITSGFSKAIFSCEAGIGSAGFAHSASENEPHKQAQWAVVEVFVDSLICIMTALAILSFPHDLSELSQTLITKAVFTFSFGKSGETFYAVAMLFFAFSSLLCWYYNGKCALSYIKNNTILKGFYTVAFSSIILITPFVTDTTIMDFSDVANALMIYVNVSALWVLISKKH